MKVAGVHVHNSQGKSPSPCPVQQLCMRYCKIPIISPGVTFLQKGFLLGLFSGEFIFGGAYYWKEFCISKWVGLDNKKSVKYSDNSLKQLKQLALTVHEIILILGGLIIGGIFA